MNGREAHMPDDRAITAIGEAGEEVREGPVIGTLEVQGPWARFAAWWCRVGRAVWATVRAFVNWCLGTSSWDDSARSEAYWQAPAYPGQPVPLVQGSTAQADSRRITREVRRLLDALGANPGDVAAYLYAAGASGVPHDADRSPIGVFLSAVLGSDPDVAAVALRTDSVTLYLRGQTAPVTVAFPGVVRDFIGAFNARCYPILLAQPEEQRRPDR